jgi:hypothetical protein
MPGSFDELSKNKAVPHALGLCFDGHGIAYSHEHGYVYMVEPMSLATAEPEDAPLAFKDARDAPLSRAYPTMTFYKLPAAAGKAAKVTRCLAKAYVKRYKARLSCASVPDLLDGIADGSDWPAVAGDIEGLLEDQGLLVTKHRALFRSPLLLVCVSQKTS